MRTYPKVLASFALFLLVQTQAMAWSGPGHAAVAVLAYRGLSADERTRFTDLLRSHPNFTLWQQDFDKLRSHGLPQDIDLGMYLFIRASIWPDEIRWSGNVFDHPNWHFVDYPLQSPSFTTGPRPDPDDDVLFGLEESLAVLGDAQADPTSRAAHLSWLIHLVGDIHQPLHCATLFSSQFRPPEGDRGATGSWSARPVRRSRQSCTASGTRGLAAASQTRRPPGTAPSRSKLSILGALSLSSSAQRRPRHGAWKAVTRRSAGPINTRRRTPMEMCICGDSAAVRMTGEPPSCRRDMPKPPGPSPDGASSSQGTGCTTSFCS